MIGIDSTATKILEHYGQSKQEIQAVQELSELIILLAARKDQRKRGYVDHVAEEIADSFIMIEQIRIAHGIQDKQINSVIVQKLSRQLGRIEKEKQENEI